MHQQHQIDYRRVERGIAYVAAQFLSLIHI